MKKDMKSIFFIFATAFLISTISINTFATSSMLEAFKFVYPNVKDSKLDNCMSCHNDKRDSLLNLYGVALKKSKLNFHSIQALDSDEDGTSNIDEINNLEFPGLNTIIPEIFLLDKNGPRGGVTFNHNMHQFDERYISNGDCLVCHKQKEFSRYLSDPTSPSREALKKHTTCYWCHWREHKAGNERVPTKCSGCHKK